MSCWRIAGSLNCTREAPLLSSAMRLPSEKGVFVPSITPQGLYLRAPGLAWKATLERIPPEK